MLGFSQIFDSLIAMFNFSKDKFQFNTVGYIALITIPHMNCSSQFSLIFQPHQFLASLVLAMQRENYTNRPREWPKLT